MYYIFWKTDSSNVELDVEVVSDKKEQDIVDRIGSSGYRLVEPAEFVKLLDERQPGNQVTVIKGQECMLRLYPVETI